jgi:hypothetical protein
MVDRSMPIPLVSLFTLVWITAPSLRAGDDPKEIIRRALRVNARNHELELAYTYVERDEQRTLDGSGAVKHRESTTWDVVPLKEASHFRRLIQRDDKPLSPQEERKQEAARKKWEAARQKTEELRAKETPEQRQKRLDDKERAHQREQREIDEVVYGLDLRLAGEEQIDGVPVWVIEGAPRPGYRFQSNDMARVLGKMKGRVWVAKSDYQPVRIEAETTDAISFGAVLARINKGMRVHVEYTYVNGEVWLPKSMTFSVSARIALFKGIHMEGNSAFSDYKKFSVDSRMVSKDWWRTGDAARGQHARTGRNACPTRLSSGEEGDRYRNRR